MPDQGAPAPPSGGGWGVVVGWPGALVVGGLGGRLHPPCAGEGRGPPPAGPPPLAGVPPAPVGGARGRGFWVEPGRRRPPPLGKARQPLFGAAALPQRLAGQPLGLDQRKGIVWIGGQPG